MAGLTAGIRRRFGLLGALWILVLPGTQMAHAAAMMRNGCDAAQMAGRGGRGSHAPMPHDASCCDLCFACCGMTALPPGPVAVAVATVVRSVDAPIPARTITVGQVAHRLPFSLGPPATSA